MKCTDWSDNENTTEDMTERESVGNIFALKSSAGVNEDS